MSHTRRIRPADLAAAEDLPVRLVLAAIRRGELPALRLGHRTILIAREDADAWIRSRTTGVPSTGPEGATT